MVYRCVMAECVLVVNGGPICFLGCPPLDDLLKVLTRTAAVLCVPSKKRAAQKCTLFSVSAPTHCSSHGRMMVAVNLDYLSQ